MNENDVVDLLDKIDHYANSQKFNKLQSLISKDATFVIKTTDIDEENTIILGYDDYFENINKVMRAVDKYSINRDIVKVALNEERSAARVVFNTEEKFISHEIEDITSSTGFFDITYVDGELIVTGGVGTFESKHNYSLSYCEKQCKDFITIFPNISSIQTSWLDSRYQGLIINNSNNYKSLNRDIALVKVLSDNKDVYALFMAPYEYERDYYKINNTRTLYKLLEDNISDFFTVQYIDPEVHKQLSDYTRYRNSLWLNDQINNLILVIPEQALIIDWSEDGQINIYSTSVERLHNVKRNLDQKKIGYKVYELDRPSFEMYRLYVSNENIAKSNKSLESLGLLNENVSKEFINIINESDYMPVLVYDDNTDNHLIDQALDMDIMLISYADLTALLEKLAKESL